MITRDARCWAAGSCEGEDHFGVRPKLKSPTQWHEAVATLAELAHADGHDVGNMLRHVVGTIHAIHRDVQSRCSSFGGDELLPILLFVVSRVRVPHLVAAVEFMNEMLCDRVLEGEGGYHLSALQSCVAHFGSLGSQVD